MFWTFDMLSVGPVVGLSVGLISGVGIGSLQHIQLVEAMSWKWKQFWEKSRSGGLIVGITVGFLERDVKLDDRLAGALVGGLIFEVLCGLLVVKHYSLRYILWFKGYTPLAFIAFPDYCAKLILLKKTRGGYIFVHRMLLEYFAGLNREA